MITYVKKSNADKYSALYERATEALRTHSSDGSKVTKDSELALIQSADDAITCLEDYFSFIVELNKIDSTYTVLPLDEDVFTIDANSRQITVPQSFAQNGISVQGDEVSEIVYFKINRFYDSTDLATKNIYIQWTAPSGEKGVSAPWVIDIESEPNYVIFGWPLSSAITKQAGQVTFAVRFYSLDENTEKINYSFATLTQTAQIKPSLDFDFENLATTGVMIDNATALITNRLVDTIPGDSTIEVNPPKWILEFNEKGKQNIYHVDEDNHIAYANLNPCEEHGGFLCAPLELRAQAVVEGDGILSYGWQGRDLNDIIFEQKFETIMIPTEDEEKIPSKLYYFKTQEDGEDFYQIYGGDSLDEDALLNVPGGVIYEKITTSTAGKMGKYIVTATNRVRHAIEKVQSYTLVIPAPVQPDIDTNLPESGIFEEGKEYEITLKVKATKTDDGTLRYYWWHKAPNATEFVQLPGQGVTGGYEVDTCKIVGRAVSGQDDEGNDIFYLVDENGVAVGDGYYYCVIENNINGGKETIQSETIRISHTATTPVVTIDGDDAYTLAEIQGSSALAINVTIPEDSGEMVPGWRTEDDTVTYQWCKYYVGDQSGKDLSDDILAASQGKYQFNHDKNLSMEPGLTEEEIEATRKPSYKPAEAGYYFCVVTNTYNGTVAQKISPFFSVANA